MTVQTEQQIALSSLIDNFLRDYYAFYPTTASNLGFHEYDGQIVDLSASAIAAHVERLRGYQQQLQQIDPAPLERLEAFDYALLAWKLAAEIWTWTEEREYTRNPMIYTYNAMVDMYIQRNYAPLPERAEALVRHLDQIPEALEVARQNLEPVVPRIFIEETQNILSGLVKFLSESLTEAMRSLNHPELAADMWSARERVVAAIEKFRAYLQNTLLPAASDEFAIGPQRFSEMLRYNELIDLPLDYLLEVGEADLQRNQAAIVELARQIDPARSIQEQMRDLGRNHPPAERLVADTRTLLDDLRQFIEQRDLVSLPTNIPCQVEETPPFARWAFAMMDTAGPFEDIATDSFYYVTPPEDDWSPEEVEGWLTKFDYATLTDVSIHEVYPGHYVHFASQRNAPTRLSKIFATYSHYESWAHYVEQMMLDQGYGSDRSDLRMAQLAEALVRNCRYVCAIKMHTQGMSVEEATRFFMEHAYMDEVTASKEARRGTHDAGYLNYTLGKLLLLKLLDQYKEAYGADFSLKRFHNEYIGYGSPPIPILRRMLLPHDDGMIL